MSFKPLLTQIKPSYFSVDCGMSYVIRTSDGKFIIIDASFGEYDEPQKLIELLRAQSPEGKTPTVAAWFFTHPHNDHIGTFTKLYDMGKDVIRIEKVYYNFPEYDWCKKTCKIDDFYAAIEFFGAEKITPQTGDVIKIQDAVFYVIYTSQDCPKDTQNVNETSLVMKMTLGKYSVMWLADIQKSGAEVLLQKYPVDFFKCDIMQVGHHGYNGGSEELYRAIDPSYLLWPIPESRYLQVLAYECNSFLANSENIKEIFVSGIEQTTFDMTEEIQCAYRYFPKKIYFNFKSECISECNIMCYKGGLMGYAALSASFENNAISLESGDIHSLLQMVQRGQIAASDKYNFSMIAVPDSQFEKLGIIFDCLTPTEPTSIKIYPIKHNKAEEFSLSLKVDRNNGTAILTLNGDEIFTKLSTKKPCPIIIYTQKGKLTIKKAIFENL